MFPSLQCSVYFAFYTAQITITILYYLLDSRLVGNTVGHTNGNHIISASIFQFNELATNTREYLFITLLILAQSILDQLLQIIGSHQYYAAVIFERVVQRNEEDGDTAHYH